MNKFMNGLKEENNFGFTENGAVKRLSTLDGLMDLFALGGAYRTRSEDEVIYLFEKAFAEDEVHALKCLFYLRDVRGGQGERRFFRVVTKSLAVKHTDAMQRNLKYVPEFGRWDDLYVFVGTPLEQAAFTIMREQYELDLHSRTPSLLAKWLKSENTSSAESCALAIKTRNFFHETPREYRKNLSKLRERIRVLERLMSQGRWDEIEFDKIPSRAGMIYKNAFAKHDIERMQSGWAAQSYEDFAKDKNTKVNAKALYPYEVVKEAMAFGGWGYGYSRGKNLTETNRQMINKYWENLADYFKGCTFNGICVADTSGSMYGDPLAVALSIAMYCAERNRGPFANTFFTFSDRPTLVEIEGKDFVDKIKRMSSANWGMSTNVEAVFDKMLDVAKRNHCRQTDIPRSVIIISDMEFNGCARANGYNKPNETLFESIERRWNAAGYKMPNLIFWNCQARQNNIPMRTSNHVTYVSGMSAVLFQQILEGKTSYDLMMDKLDSKRYSCIH